MKKSYLSSLKRLLSGVLLIMVLGLSLAPLHQLFAVGTPVEVFQGIKALGGADPCADKPASECYQLLEPFGTFDEKNQPVEVTAIGLDATKTIGTTFNNFYYLTIGFASLLGVLLIAWYGFQYMRNEQNVATIAVIKDKIGNVIIGLLLLVSIYVILNTINPQLLDVQPDLAEVNLKSESITALSDADYASITGTIKPLPAAIEKIVIEKAKQLGMDPCIAKVLIAKESGSSGAGAIGHDENVRSSDIPSRNNFIKSGITFLKKTFNVSSVKDKTINDDKIIKTGEPGLGLDWRFSHGIGLMQVTFFPKDISGGRNYPLREGISPKEALEVSKNIELGLKIFKINSNNNYCNNNFENAFKAYNGGSCNTSNNFAVSYGRVLNAAYNLCKSGK